MPDDQRREDGTDELRLKSRELRIALAAVLGTVVIGITGPIVTWRAGVSGQRSASHEQRVATDLVELRSVADKALADLLTYETAVRDYQSHAFSAQLLSELGIDKPSPAVRMLGERAWKRFGPAQNDGARLALRLGPSSIVDRYSDALKALHDVISIAETATLPHVRRAKSVDAERKKAQTRLDAAEKARMAFTRQATALVGSELEAE